MCCDTMLSSLTRLGISSPLTVYYGGLIVFIKGTEVDTRGCRRAAFPATLFPSFLFSAIFAFPLFAIFIHYFHYFPVIVRVDQSEAKKKVCFSRPKCLSPLGNLPVCKTVNKAALGLLYCIQFSEQPLHFDAHQPPDLHQLY